MFRKVLEHLKRHLFNKKGSDIIAVALILLFIILAAAPYVKDLGTTTKNGVISLNEEMSNTLSGE